MFSSICVILTWFSLFPVFFGFGKVVFYLLSNFLLAFPSVLLTFFSQVRARLDHTCFCSSCIQSYLKLPPTERKSVYKRGGGNTLGERTCQNSLEFLHEFTAELKTILEDHCNKNRQQLDDIIQLLQKLERKPTVQSFSPVSLHGNDFDQDVATWLDEFDRIARLNGWSLTDKINALPLYLDGVAKTWFLNLPAETQNNYDLFKEVFLARFDSEEVQLYLWPQLRDRKQKAMESVDHYASDIQKYSKRLHLSEIDAMRHFIDGLLPDLQNFVLLKQPTSLAAAAAEARLKQVVSNRDTSLPDTCATISDFAPRAVEPNDVDRTLVTTKTEREISNKHFHQTSRQVSRRLQPRYYKNRRKRSIHSQQPTEN